MVASDTSSPARSTGLRARGSSERGEKTQGRSDPHSATTQYTAHSSDNRWLRVIPTAQRAVQAQEGPAQKKTQGRSPPLDVLQASTVPYTAHTVPSASEREIQEPSVQYMSKRVQRRKKHKGEAHPSTVLEASASQYTAHIVHSASEQENEAGKAAVHSRDLKRGRKIIAKNRQKLYRSKQ